MAYEPPAGDAGQSEQPSLPPSRSGGDPPSSVPPPPPPPGRLGPTMDAYQSSSPGYRDYGNYGDYGGAYGLEEPGTLTQTYVRVVTKPSVALFEQEIPRADWSKVLIGVGLVTLTSVIAAAIVAYVLPSILPQLYNTDSQFTQIQDQLRRNNVNLENISWFFNALRFFSGSGGVLVTLFSTPISFFIGAFVVYLSARIFGGRGSNFLTHSYLLSLSYTPTKFASALLSLVPFIGGLAAIALAIYQLYLAGLSLQASQKMEPGKSMAAAFVPVIAYLLLICLVVVIFAFALVAAVRPNQ